MNGRRGFVMTIDGREVFMVRKEHPWGVSYSPLPKPSLTSRLRSMLEWWWVRVGLVWKGIK